MWAQTPIVSIVAVALKAMRVPERRVGGLEIRAGQAGRLALLLAKLSALLILLSTVGP
jgi:hypothetical protein